MKTVGILGGGISGLCASYYLKKSQTSTIKLFEASSRVGGWIRSCQSAKGHVLENGPRTLRPRGEVGENTLALINELGLSDKVMFIPRNHPAALNRLVYVNKKLHALPNNVLSLIRTRAPFSKPLISALLQDMRAPQKLTADESIYDFTERRFGREIADYAVSPLICGVCAGDAKEISVKFLMKSLFEAEQRHGSVIKGFLKETLRKKESKPSSPKNILAERSKKENWSVYSLQGGLETLPKSLESKVKTHGTEIVLNSPCQKITFDTGKVNITANNKTYEFDNVISSLPAKQLASLLKEQHPTLSQELAEIPYVTVGVVNLQYSGKVLNEVAFGFLVPPSQDLPILGIVFDSCCFPNKGDTVMTVMMGGRWFEQLFGSSPSPEALLDTAVRHASSILGITSDPEHHNVSILHQCIPQYVIGHHERIDRIRSYIQSQNLPLFLCGSSYDGVGVNDAIYSAKQAAISVK